MGIHGNIKNKLLACCLLLISSAFSAGNDVFARGIAPAFTAPMHHTGVSARHRTTGHSHRRSTGTSSQKRVTQYQGRRRREVIVTSHHLRHQRSKRHKVRHVARDRHAYPVNFFMMSAPGFDKSPLPVELSQRIQNQFQNGTADSYSTRALVRSGLVLVHPMHGGIFWRREPVKYIIVHSTETGIPIGATRVIDAWTSMGRRHAGAQYVVERDGTIYQAVDPDLATVHINIFKTLPGINNDNSIGIEMVHAGKQTYPPEQRQAVVRLVTYLQDRYKVEDADIITHRYAQQGDHTDPVAFDWDGFLAEQKRFHMKAVAMRMNKVGEEIAKLTPDSGLQAAVYMQPHGTFADINKATNPNAEAPTEKAAAESKAAEKTASETRPAERAASVAKPAETTAVAAPDAEMRKKSATFARPAVLKPVQMPALRGPIEMDPHTATMLNSIKSETEQQGSSDKK